MTHQELIMHKSFRDKCRNNVLNFFPKDKEVFVYHPRTDALLVSNMGRVKNGIDGKILKSHKNRNNYDCINVVYSNGRRMSSLVHRLVADTFYCYFNNDNYIMEVNHIDANKDDNSIYNLEWMTRAENLQHARDLRLFKGAKKHSCQIFRKDFKDIRDLYSLGFKMKEIAKSYDVTTITISDVINKRGRFGNE